MDWEKLEVAFFEIQAWEPSNMVWNRSTTRIFVATSFLLRPLFNFSTVEVRNSSIGHSTNMSL